RSGACARFARARSPAHARADCRSDKSVDVVVRRQSKELDVAIVGRDAVEELRAFLVFARIPRLVTEVGLHHGQFFGEQPSEQFLGDFLAVLQLPFWRTDPLPDLRARDFCGGRILHQIEYGHATVTREPSPQVRATDRDRSTTPDSAD